MYRWAENGPQIVPKPSPSSSRVGSPDGKRQQDVPVASVGVSKVTLETVPKPARRVFSAADKLRIVNESNACVASGQRGELEALLRREGIYSSHLSAWRQQLGLHGAAGLAAKKPGRKPKLTQAERRNAELVKRNAELERRLHVANVLIALQKKAHEVLGIALPESVGEI
jgi:transposase